MLPWKILKMEPLRLAKNAFPETFNHLFKCSSGLFFNSKLKNSNLMKVSHYNDLISLKHLGTYLIKYRNFYVRKII